MPRPARPTSNFTSDDHAFYTGWVLHRLTLAGIPAVPVRDEHGGYTNRLRVDLAPDATITLLIPPPPDDWDLLATARTGPTFRGNGEATT